MYQPENRQTSCKQLLGPAGPEVRSGTLVRGLLLTTLLIGVFTAAGCAPGPNSLAHTANGQEVIAGFWLGLWHGMIAPITFVISLFSKNVHLYEVHNNGAWYNCGFLLGACISLGGGAGGAARRSSPRCDSPPRKIHVEISTESETPAS